MAVQGEAAFPLLANLSLCLAVRLRPGPRGPKPLFAVIPVSAGLERFVAVPGESGYAFMLVEDIVARFVDRLFPGETVAESAVFRITRNADLSAREDDAADFLAEMESVLSRRRVSGCVRLEVEEATSRILTVFLRRALAVAESGVCRVRGPLDLSAFHRLAAMQGFTRLKYEPWPPQPLPQLDPKKSLFDELARQSVVLSHPYDSFDPVVRLVEEAAADPNVLAIKQILYRTSANSPIVAALRRAAERGKYVTAIVELKARFDEARNIEWARRLEEAGAQVIYGVKGLKTHAKLCIVVRREPRGIARYLHFGTGNYNEKTARLYSDIGYLTSDEDLGADASAFFNAVSGYSVPQSFVKLAAAPMGLRRKLTELIEAEVQRRREGQPALIMAKMNSLADPSIINSLYRASQAGVEVLLNVRGICCLRPGVKGLSESITVVSVVDRFLEHSRVFYFHQGGQAKVFLSSADWMPRNLDRRIELMAPVEDAACRKKLIALLRTCLADSVNAWRLRPDGTYERLRPARGRRAVRSQEVLYREGRAAARAARQAKRTVFEPHRPPEREP
jgi:polyphosphate kinase